NKNLKLKSGRTGGLLLIAILIGMGMYFYFKYSNLKDRGKFTNGIAEGWSQPAGPGKAGIIHIDYSYDVSGVKDRENRTYSSDVLPYDVWNREFIGRPILVYYDSLNPKNSTAIIVPQDFRRYGLPCPDSLKWVTDPRYQLTGPPRKN